MPEGYKPLMHRYSLQGPPPGVGFSRRTDYNDVEGGRQANRHPPRAKGCLADRLLKNDDIPADNIGGEILRGTRELTGRRLPRYLRPIRTEENEFPYSHPMKQALADHERVVEDWRRL